jgi:hypothetical protein
VKGVTVFGGVGALGGQPRLHCLFVICADAEGKDRDLWFCVGRHLTLKFNNLFRLPYDRNDASKIESGRVVVDNKHLQVTNVNF